MGFVLMRNRPASYSSLLQTLSPVIGPDCEESCAAHISRIGSGSRTRNDAVGVRLLASRARKLFTYFMIICQLAVKCTLSSIISRKYLVMGAILNHSREGGFVLCHIYLNQACGGVELKLDIVIGICYYGRSLWVDAGWWVVFELGTVMAEHL